MEFYYILAIVYSIEGTELDAQIILPSSSECDKVIRTLEDLSDTLPANLFCINTGKLSSSIRPVLRPSSLLENN